MTEEPVMGQTDRSGCAATVETHYDAIERMIGSSVVASYRAVCACGWRGPWRDTSTAAWASIRSHDQQEVNDGRIRARGPFCNVG